jgi:sugar (pentulose or hexulose) kinase
MTSMLTLGIDSGTQGSKAVIFNRDSGQIESEAYAAHALTKIADGSSIWTFSNSTTRLVKYRWVPKA